MKNLFHLLLLGSTLCCAAAGSGAAPPQEMHYSFDLHDSTHIHVTLDLDVRQPGP